MKIGYLTTYFYPVIGGVENSCFYLAKELAKKHDIRIYTADKKDNKKFKKYEVINNIKINRFKSFRYKYYLAFYPGMLFKVLKEDIDVLHVHSIGFLWHDLIVLIKKIVSPNTKIINTPYGPFMALKSYSFYERILKSSVEFIEKPINKKYHKVIEINPSQKKWLLESEFNEKSIIYIPCGIPKDSLIKSSPAHFLKKYNLKNRFIISYIGRIQEYKGLDQIIKILPELIKVNPNITFLVIGKDAGYKENLEKLISEYNVKDHVLFTGEVSEAEKLGALESSEIFILPSEWEAFGIVILEAMAKKNAIISTTTEGGRFLVKNNTNGFLYNFNDLEELKKITTKLIKDDRLRKKIQLNNFNKAKQFTWDKIAKELEKVYHS